MYLYVFCNYVYNYPLCYTNVNIYLLLSLVQVWRGTSGILARSCRLNSVPVRVRTDCI